MTVIHGDISWVSIVVVYVAWSVGLRMSIKLDDEGIRVLVGATVADALARSHITVKEAAAIMSIDESQLRHGLRGEKGYHISLARLAMMPMDFWAHFWPSVAYLVAKKNVNAIVEDMGLRRSA